MTKAVITHSVTLIVHECPTCAMPYAVPDDFDRRKREDGGSWYCPSGHAVSYTKSENAKLKAQLAAAQDARDMAEQRAEWAERSKTAYKGQVTRLRKRVAAGVCPCCHRSFANVARHMAGQHPGFATEDVQS